MAGGQERELRRRIKSVQSTRKITKAMELIAASRISKAQDRVAAARPYADLITQVISNLAAAGAAGDSPLLAQRDEINTVAFVVVAGDRGLSGAYNTNVIRTAERAMAAERAAGRDTALVTVGKKPTRYFRFRGHELHAQFGGFAEQPGYEDARAVAASVTGAFEDGTFDQVRLVHTRFLSIGTQRVTDSTYLPLERTAEQLGEVSGPAPDYEFEPNPTEILDRLLPRYAEARLFAALLEGAASFYAAQQRAMKAATDNAEELITKLSREMNRARQAAITTEIMEIVGGAEALQEGDDDDVADLLADITGGREDLLPDELAAGSRQGAR